MGRNIKSQRNQYGSNHHVVQNIYAEMGNTILCVDFKLWDKCKVVFGMTSAKYGKDLILFGECK